jgi:sulfur-oxidizing protein SoxX
MRWLLSLSLFLLVSCRGGAVSYAFDEAAPLANPGQVEAGEVVFVQREQGHCVLCHQVAALDAPFQGNIGPDLSTVGTRLSPAQIRFRIVDASRLNPVTTMPAYYRVENLNRVAEQYQGTTVLTAQQVEHLVAYLAQLK